MGSGWTYGFDERVPERTWTYELVHGRRVLCEAHELAVDVLRDTTADGRRQQWGLRRRCGEGEGPQVPSRHGQQHEHKAAHGGLEEVE